jgi:hypothetical protein
MTRDKSSPKRTAREDSIEIDCVEREDGAVVVVFREKGNNARATIDPLETLKASARRGPKRAVHPKPAR